jgi:hypothetical protein
LTFARDWLRIAKIKMVFAGEGTRAPNEVSRAPKAAALDLRVGASRWKRDRRAAHRSPKERRLSWK